MLVEGRGAEVGPRVHAAERFAGERGMELAGYDERDVVAAAGELRRDGHIGEDVAAVRHRVHHHPGQGSPGCQFTIPSSGTHDLPGHSPGTIGLWDVDAGVLFSGDAVHDGPELDEVPGADIDAYVETMELLHDLPVEVVHAGHGPSFGRDRLRELTRGYLDGRRPSLV